MKRLVPLLAATLVAALAAAPAAAQSNLLGELERLVNEALPPIIGQENTELVQNLHSARLGTQLPKSFDVQKVVAALFGRVPPAFAPDCQRRTTPVGDPDAGECVATRGEPGGQGAFTALAFSKTLGFGNISFVRREAQRELKQEELKPVQMGDRDAFEMAHKWMTAFGIPESEIATPPAGAELPVREILVGLGGEGQTIGPAGVGVQKVVSLQRGLQLPKPLPGPGGIELGVVPAPGGALVALDDAQLPRLVRAAWPELRAPEAAVDPREVKTRQQLVEEIAEDLLNNGVRQVSRLSSRLGLAMDWKGDHGVLKAVIWILVAPSPDQPTREAGATLGTVHEYNLVGFERSGAPEGR